MKEKIKTSLKGLLSLRFVLGLVLGAAAGFAYYYFVGCQSGQCAITSSPVNSTLYGMVLGGLIMYKETPKKTAEEQK